MRAILAVLALLLSAGSAAAQINNGGGNGGGAGGGGAITAPLDSTTHAVANTIWGWNGSAVATVGVDPTYPTSLQVAVENATLPGVTTQANSIPTVGAVSNPLPLLQGTFTAPSTLTPATANGNGTPLATTGYNGGIIEVNCTASCTGSTATTINFEGSIDGTTLGNPGTPTWVPIQGTPVGGGTPTSTFVPTSSAAPSAFGFNFSGFQLIRARISNYNTGSIVVLGIAASGNGTQVQTSSGSAVVQTSHAATTGLGTSLIVKASQGGLLGFNCTGITGGAAGYCVAYNATSVPSNNASLGSGALDACQFSGSSGGCSLSRIPTSANYSTGIVILMTTNVSPYTYTTGTDTGMITADYQ